MTTKKQTVWRMLAVAMIFSLALIGCDPESDPGSGPTGVNYTAVADGNANTTSTKITFTFGESVTDLTAAEITLTAGTGSVTKGTLSGSEKVWTLNLSSVTTAGDITVKITKEGITANTKTVKVYKKVEESVGADPVGGKTTYFDREKYTFTANGTYTIYKPKEISSGVYDYDQDNKYQWEVDEIGTYTWNTTNKTITLTPAQITVNGQLVDKDGYRFWYKAQIDDMITGMMEDEDMTQAEAEEALLAMVTALGGVTGITTIDEFLDFVVNGNFTSSQSYNYSFFDTNTVLFLQTVLPATKGSDELAGKTFNGSATHWDAETSTSVVEKDASEEYKFIGAGTTYTYSKDDVEKERGVYSYDSTTSPKSVYFRTTELMDDVSKKLETPQGYYDNRKDTALIVNYPSKSDYAIAVTNDAFNPYRGTPHYDLPSMCIGPFYNGAPAVDDDDDSDG